MSGVDVKIIIPAKPDHLFVHSCSLSYIGELLESGVRCFEYRKGFIHSKVMTMDGIVTSVGTANMDIRSYKLNFEVNAFIYNGDVTAEFDKQFNIDIDDCTEITLEIYKNRGIYREFKSLLQDLFRLCYNQKRGCEKTPLRKRGLFCSFMNKKSSFCV